MNSNRNFTSLLLCTSHQLFNKKNIFSDIDFIQYGGYGIKFYSKYIYLLVIYYINVEFIGDNLNFYLIFYKNYYFLKEILLSISRKSTFLLHFTNAPQLTAV